MTEEKRYGVDQAYALGLSANNPACAVNKTKPDFVPGMVVRLKSGSPALTVTSISATRSATVQWWNGQAMDVAHFPFECLIPGDKTT